MATTYSPELVKELSEQFHSAQIDRPLRIGRYEAGTELTYDVTGVAAANTGQIRVKVERFVGGGFAGQVYRVELLELTAPVGNLQVGEHYAMKILIPPSGFAQRFRDVL